MNHVLESALAYATRGWQVLPIVRGSKVPATAHGFHDATTDEAQIRQWFEASPTLNIAMATGRASAVWVLDLDAGSQDSILDWAEFGGLPETLAAMTGSGNRHLFFKNPPELTVKSRVKFATGCDTRGEGGYAVLPPSITAKPYAWLNDNEPLFAPDWLLRLVTGKQQDLDFVEICASGLADAPGASAGSRHSMACSLVGKELARGTDPTVLLGLALEWAKRCSPPMEDEELLNIVKRLIAKHKDSSATAIADDLESLALPPAEPWPSLPSVALRHGVIAEFLDRVLPCTEADPVALVVALLVAFGNAVGRSPHSMVGGATRHGVNEFCVIVGQTGKGRKGTGLDVSLRPVRESDPEWAADRIVSGLTSGEGIIHAVRDAVTKTEPVRDRGSIVDYEVVVVDPGVVDKRLLVIETELGSSLRACRREQSTLSPILRAAWDAGSLRVLAKHAGEKATDPHVSLIGNITVEELKRLTSEVDVFGGLFNRVLWCLSKRSKLLPDGGELRGVKPLMNRIAELIEVAKTVGIMRRTAKAKTLWAKEYGRLTTVHEVGVVGGVLGRGEAHSLRLSMLMALLAGHAAVDENDLRAGIDLYDYCAASARVIFGGAGACETPLDARVIAAIRATTGIGRSGIHRALGGKVLGRDLVGSLARLRDSGAIVAVSLKTGGRPAEAWSLAGEQAPSKDVISLPPTLLTSSFGPAPAIIRRTI